MSTMLAGSPPSPAEPTERRLRDSHAAPSRPSVVIDDRRASFCLVRAISPVGAQLRLFAPIARHSTVRLLIDDDESMVGEVVWVRDQLAGVAFNAPLEPDRLARASRKPATGRRASPRVNVVARAILRTPGQVFPGELANISASGASVRTRGQTLGEGREVSLVLPDLPAIRAIVRWNAETRLGLVFEAPIAMPMLAAWLAGRLRVTADPVPAPAPAPALAPAPAANG